MAVAADLVQADLGALPLPLRTEDLFGRACPLEVEIGVGKGRFITEWAAAHPDVGLIGVERVRKYLALASTRAMRRGLANVRLVHTTAEDLLFRCLGPGSVAGFHVYFPDPWPKKKHQKRRFFRPANVARLAELLAPGGVLLVKTDHGGYADVIGEVLAAETRWRPIDVEEAFEGLPETSYEVKYGREGRPVWRFATRR